jgi:hypothetical protein
MTDDLLYCILGRGEPQDTQCRKRIGEPAHRRPCSWPSGLRPAPHFSGASSLPPSGLLASPAGVYGHRWLKPGVRPRRARVV